MSYRLEFEIPILPKMPNALLGAHWRVRSENKKCVLAHVGAATSGRRPREPLHEAALILTRFSAVEPDQDGLSGSFKPVLDAMKDLRILKDDRPAVIGQPIYRWEKCPPKQGKIHVIVRGTE